LDSIDRLIPQHVSACPSHDIGIPSPYAIVFSMFNDLIGGCLFCWYRCNYLSFLSIMYTAEIFSVNAKLQSTNQLDVKIDVISWIFYASGVLVYFILIIKIGESKYIIITYSL
jgi:hypothetical protein